jgi:acetolactate synthase-1/2/3 large subunit
MDIDTSNTPKTVAQLLLKYLEIEGVRHIFGIPGGALKCLVDEMKNQHPRFTYFICRHETGAAYIADGYSRISGVPGVVMVTSGPGALNALTGAMNAQSSGTPQLTITGEVAQQYFGRMYLQEGIDSGLNVNQIFASATAYSSVISSPSNAETLITTALRATMSLPSQAAHLSLPDDVACGTLPAQPVLPASPAQYRATPASSNRAQVADAFRALTSARRPLIFLGNGCRRALMGDGLKRLTTLVERFAIPVVTTPDAKAIFPESHTLSLRNFGTAYCEWPQYYIGAPGKDHFDALLVLGSALGGLATGNWNASLKPSGPLIQIDLDQKAIGRGYPVTLGIVAEVGQVLADLAELAESTKPNARVVTARRKLVEQIKSEHSPFLEPEKMKSTATPMLPQALMKCINEGLPKGSQVFLDAGNCVGWGVHYLAFDPPGAIHAALDMGPMGFGLCAAIGARIAARDRTCVGIVGDGAFLMHGAELSTAARYGIGAILIVLKDDNLLMVSQGQAHFTPDHDNPGIWTDLFELGSADLEAFSEALGAEAYSARSPAEMKRALARAIHNADLNDTPQVIVAHIDRNEIPPYYQTPAI